MNATASTPPRYALGIDVGGTTIKATVVDNNGHILMRETTPTPHGGDQAARAIAAAVDFLTQAIAAEKVLAADGNQVHLAEVARTIGVCVPGLVDETTGTAVLSVNVGWQDFPMAEAITSITGRPVLVGNDTRTGSLAEKRWGAGTDAESMLYCAIGTGISACIVVDGAPLVLHPWATEVGQLLIPDPDGHKSHKTLETVCSARAVAERYAAITGADHTTIHAEDVFAAAAAGEHHAQHVIDTAINPLAEIFSAAVGFVGPIPIVIGGGLAQAAEGFFTPLRKKLAERLGPEQRPTVIPAKLGPLSQALGCAARVFDAEGC